MFVGHERIIHDDAPSPRQIEKLASVGVGFAAEREKLKSLKSSPHSHYHVDEVDLCSPDDNGDITQIRHRMAGRVGVRKDFEKEGGQVWSYKLFDTRWIFNGEQWVASRVLYRFEHNRRQTLIADRSVRAVGLGPVYGYDEEDPLYSQLVNFAIEDDAVAFLSARQEFEAVTSKECNILLQEAVGYTDMIRSIHRQDVV